MTQTAVSLITPGLLLATLGAPVLDAKTVADKLAWAAARADIDSPLRVAHFLGQIASESRFRPIDENLMYTAKRISEVWPNRYPTPLSVPRSLVYSPENLANTVYANRMGNGPFESGDGYRYRARGLFQITGADLYGRYGRAIGYDLLKFPELAGQIGVSALLAAHFWAAHGLNRLADANDLKGITVTVNGSPRTVLERQRYFVRAARSLGIKAA